MFSGTIVSWYRFFVSLFCFTHLPIAWVTRFSHILPDAPVQNAVGRAQTVDGTELERLRVARLDLNATEKPLKSECGVEKVTFFGRVSTCLDAVEVRSRLLSVSVV
jgi:hypothetical protein